MLGKHTDRLFGMSFFPFEFHCKSTSLFSVGNNILPEVPHGLVSNIEGIFKCPCVCCRVIGVTNDGCSQLLHGDIWVLEVHPDTLVVNKPRASKVAFESCLLFSGWINSDPNALSCIVFFILFLLFNSCFPFFF